MGTTENKNIKIINSTATIVAIILLAIYFIQNFLNDGRTVLAWGYVIILGLVIYFCSKKMYFYENVYYFFVFFILGELLKYSITHFKDLRWFLNAWAMDASGTEYFKMIISSPYVYIYLIGVLLLIIRCFAPKLCGSDSLKTVFEILGGNAIFAIIFHIGTVRSLKYEIMKDIVFFIFMISAFWCAYIEEDFQISDGIKEIIAVVEIFLFVRFYPKQYEILMDKIINISDMAWYYVFGICLISVICILSKQAIQDSIIGFIILGTYTLMLFGKKKQITFEPRLILFFNIIAASLFYFVKKIFRFEKDNTKIKYLKPLYICCYIASFMLIAFIQLQYSTSVIFLCLGLLLFFVYFGKIIDFKGTIYGTIIFGSIPCILLANTMNLAGKANSSLLSNILFIIMFWCICSGALFWKDSFRIKSIAFSKTNSEGIVNLLVSMTYLLTVVALFIC